MRSTARGGSACSAGGTALARDGSDSGTAAPSAPLRPGSATAAGEAALFPRSGRRGRRERHRLIGATSGEADRLVEGLVLRRRHLGVPVASAGRDLARRSSTAARTTEEQRVEDAGRGHVEEDLGEVLAADQVDVIDAQVDGRHLVAGGAARSLPLDHLGQATSQPVACTRKARPLAQAAWNSAS